MVAQFGDNLIALNLLPGQPDLQGHLIGSLGGLRSFSRPIPALRCPWNRWLGCQCFAGKFQGFSMSGYLLFGLRGRTMGWVWDRYAKRQKSNMALKAVRSTLWQKKASLSGKLLK